VADTGDLEGNTRRFVLGEPLNVDETRVTEFKEVRGKDPVRAIANTADEYAVAFLNSDGGRISWGVRDSDHTVLGVSLPLVQRDRLRKEVANKLNGIQPQIDPTRFHLEIHRVEGANPLHNLVVVELIVPTGDSSMPYFTSGHEVFVRVDGVKKRLSGPQLTDWIRTRMRNSISAPNSVDVPEVLGLVTRIRRILSAHGLSAGHLSRFFKSREANFTIDLRDTQTDGAFVAWLEEAKIEWIANTFLIRREWIDGEDARIHDEPYFDKQPRKFFATIGQHTTGLIFEDLPASPEAYFIRWGKGKDWRKKGGSKVFVVVAVPVARFSNERIIFKYITDHQAYPWDYERTNIQLRAWARLLFLHRGVACFGCEIPMEIGEAVESNALFLPELIEGDERFRRIEWYPEDYGLYPSESAQAKDTDTLPDVITFLRSHNLPWQATE
jgi:hypothetical protein